MTRCDCCSGFKVFAVIPLLYVDAKVDSTDRRRFRVLVRSWKALPQMCKVEPEGVHGAGEEGDSSAGTAGGTTTNFNKTRRGSQTESFRKASETSTFWSLTLAMETEQACMLAVQHIETRRQEIFAQKMTRLKGILRQWAAPDASPTEAVAEDGNN